MRHGDARSVRARVGGCLELEFRDSPRSCHARGQGLADTSALRAPSRHRAEPAAGKIELQIEAALLQCHRKSNMELEIK